LARVHNDSNKRREIHGLSVGRAEDPRYSQCATLLLEQIRTNETALFDVPAVSLPDRLAKVRNRD
jgi:hypothetical protein